MKNIIQEIRSKLKNKGEKRNREGAPKSFKEKIKLYGVKTFLVHSISKEYFKKIKDLDKKDIFRYCEELWRSGFLEESLIACNWSFFIYKKYEEKDFKTFEKWIKRYINNWASCDTFCTHTVGYFLEMYPSYVKELKKWAKSKNRWERRSSAVSLIVPAKKGKFSKDIFEICDILLIDQDDLVQKGYGWLLKVYSQIDQKKVFDYVMKNKKKMPRTSLRYAIEKMPKNLKDQAMRV